jgi:hypothetical protein
MTGYAFMTGYDSDGGFNAIIFWKVEIMIPSSVQKHCDLKANLPSFFSPNNLVLPKVGGPRRVRPSFSSFWRMLRAMQNTRWGYLFISTICTLNKNCKIYLNDECMAKSEKLLHICCKNFKGKSVFCFTRAISRPKSCLLTGKPLYCFLAKDHHSCFSAPSETTVVRFYYYIYPKELGSFEGLLQIRRNSETATPIHFKMTGLIPCVK